MTSRRNNRGRGRGNRRARIPAELRHNAAVTLTRYVPPVHPRPREHAFKVRRVIQRSFTLKQDSSSATQGILSVLPSDWLSTEFSTNGFEMMFLHRVAVWSEIVVPATGRTVWPTILLYHNYPAGTTIYPDFRGTCGAYNERARVGYYVPSHLSGPYSKNETKTMIYAKVYSSADDTFPVQTVQVEIDATFC